MSGINTGKVVTGGILAAVVFFAVDFVTFGFALKTEFEANSTRLGLDPAAMNTPAAMVMWVVQEIAFGLLVVWTYAAIRPRFGPGPKTAIYAGLLFYVATFLMMLSMAQGGIMPMSLFWKAAGFSLISIVAGSIAGAWAYKEA